MKLIKILIFVLLGLQGFSQSIIGGAGVCQVDANPNTISGMQTRNPEVDCMKAHNYLTGEEWKFDNSQTGSKWVLLKTEGKNIYDVDGSSNEDRVYDLMGNELELQNARLELYDDNIKNSIFIGDDNTGVSNTGVYNIGIGSGSIPNSTGNYNIGLGRDVLRDASLSGGNNIGIGRDVLYSNTVGVHNYGFGNAALKLNVNGSYNFAAGSSAMGDNVNGSNNVAIGNAALRRNISGSNNIAMGTNSMTANTTGGANNAMGYFSLKDNLTGSYNTAFGFNSLTRNQTGSNNAAIGFYSLNESVSGGGNVAIGNSAMRYSDSPTGSVAIGSSALLRKAGSYNIALGSITQDIGLTGSFNISMGLYSLRRSTGAHNIAIGYQCAHFLEAGASNIVIGSSALSGASTAASSNNVVIGSSAARTIGASNVSIGNRSAFNATGGNNNTILGYQAGYNNAGSANIFIGVNSGYNELGSNKLYISNSTTADPLIYGDFTTNRLKINKDLEVDRHIFDSDESAGNNGQVLSRDAGGIVWVDTNGVPSGGTSGQILSTDGNNNYSWVDDQTGGGATADGVVNSATGTVGSATRSLNRTIGSPVVIDVTDGDADPTNEIETWATLAGIPTDIADGDDDTQLTEADVDLFVANNGYLTTEVDGSTTNEIQTITKSGSTITLSNGGGSVTDENTQLNETQVDAFVANNGYITSEVDGSITNEIELPVGGSNGDILETDGAGNYTWVTPSSGADGNGIYDGSGTLSANTTVTLDGKTLEFDEEVDFNNLDVSNNLKIGLGLLDSQGQSGATGQFLARGGIGVDWQDINQESTTVTDSENIDFTLNGSDVTGIIKINPASDNIITSTSQGIKATSDGDGIYDGSGTVPTATTVTLTDRLAIVGEAVEIYDSGDNSFLGKNSGSALTTGTGNTAISLDAGKSLTSGFDNTFIGPEAGMNTTFGDNNTFIGVGAGKTNISGNNNVFIGKNASFASSTGQSNKLVIDGNGFPALLSGDFSQEWIKIDGDLEVTGHIEDQNSSSGTTGQFLSRDNNGIIWQDGFSIPTGGSNGQILATDGTGTVGGLYWTDDATGGGGTADGVVTGFTTNTAGTNTRGVQRSVGTTLTLNVEDGDSDPTNEVETWSTLAGIPTDFSDDIDDVDDADNDPTNELDGNGIYQGSGTVPSGTVSTLSSTGFGAWKINNGDSEIGPQSRSWRVDDLSSTANIQMGFNVADKGMILSAQGLTLYGNAGSPNITLENNEIHLHAKVVDTDGNAGNDGEVLVGKTNQNGKVIWSDALIPSYGSVSSNSTQAIPATGFETISFAVNSSNDLGQKNTIYDFTANTIEVEKDGIFSLDLFLFFDSDDGAKVQVELRKNGGNIQRDLIRANTENTSNCRANFSYIEKASVGDVFSVHVRNMTNDGSLQATQVLSGTRFKLSKISQL